QPAVIVTRPAEQAGALLQALQQRGYATRHLPLMDIVPLADDDAAATSGLRARLMNLDESRAVIVISVNAATIGLDSLHRYGPQPPLGSGGYAGGRSTAEVLQRAGLTVHCPAERFDSEGILALPGWQPELIAGQKVLLRRGIGA